MSESIDFLDELAWRGLLHQTTNDAELREHLTTPGRIAYCGFDPTRDSLTIGNLIPVMMLRHFQQAGHKVIVLMGGGTGMVGDPSGKDAERQLLDEAQIRKNVEGQQAILEKLLDFSDGKAVVVNNAEWLGKLGFLEVLRDVGKYFSINAMIQKDSVRDRLHNREQGISYTEFSYMLLQAYDFLHLMRENDCSVQMAGSDQYGNITAGIDLIRRTLGKGDSGSTPAYGVTAPLVTKADGKKIGKTETGAVWLSADRTSPYAFYQFWINADDADVLSFLKWYTPLAEAEIGALMDKHLAAPHERQAQRQLARAVTALIHGEAEVQRVEAAAKALFGGDVRGLDADMLQQVFADVPHSEHKLEALAGDGLSLVELLTSTSLASSKREARQFLSTGAVSVNGQKVDAEHKLTTADLLHGTRILLKRGKKKWHATAWV